MEIAKPTLENTYRPQPVGGPFVRLAANPADEFGHDRGREQSFSTETVLRHAIVHPGAERTVEPLRKGDAESHFGALEKAPRNIARQKFA